MTVGKAGEGSRRCKEGSGGVEEHWVRTSSAELSGTRAEKSQAKGLSQIGPT